LRRKLNTANSKSATTPAAMIHHCVELCLRVPVGVTARAAVEAVTLCPGDAESALKENLPLTG
jgi:hypothetical protein